MEKVNKDELVKSRKHHLLCTEIQKFMTFPPSVSRLFTTPTILMGSEKTKTQIAVLGNTTSYNLSAVGGEAFFDTDNQGGAIAD